MMFRSVVLTWRMLVTDNAVDSAWYCVVLFVLSSPLGRAVRYTPLRWRKSAKPFAS